MAEIVRNVDNFNQDDMSRPVMILIQATTQNKPEGSQPGQFFNNMSQEVFKEGLEIIILDFYKTRTYWGRDVIGEEAPECSSNNAASNESVDGKDCTKCEKRLDSAWAVDAQKRRTYCTIQYSLLCMMIDTFEPFLLRASGISTGAVQKLLARINYNKALRNAQGKIDWHKFKVTVKSKEEKHPSGLAWALEFGEITPFGDANFENTVLRVSAGYLGQINALPAAGEATQEEKQVITSADVGKVEKVLPVPATKVTVTPTIRVIGEEKGTPPGGTGKQPPASTKKAVTLDI